MIEVKVKEVLKHNYIIDVMGIGLKQFDFSTVHIPDLIESDLKDSYECINYVNSSVKIEDVYTTDSTAQDKARIEVKAAFKTDSTYDIPDDMISTIEGYLTNVFVK